MFNNNQAFSLYLIVSNVCRRSGAWSLQAHSEGQNIRNWRNDRIQRRVHLKRALIFEEIWRYTAEEKSNIDVLLANSGVLNTYVIHRIRLRGGALGLRRILWMILCANSSQYILTIYRSWLEVCLREQSFTIDEAINIEETKMGIMVAVKASAVICLKFNLHPIKILSLI